MRKIIKRTLVFYYTNGQHTKLEFESSDPFSYDWHWHKTLKLEFPGKKLFIDLTKVTNVTVDEEVVE